VDDLDGDGLYPRGPIILLCIALKLVIEPEVVLARGGEATFRGPHAGQHLAHRMEGAFHCSRLDSFTAGNDGARVVALCKDI
jgi:hypothetical protein